MKNFKSMNEDDWKKCKEILGFGLNLTQASKIVGRSVSTVSRIRDSKSFVDYKILVSVANAGSRAKPVEKIDVPKFKTPGLTSSNQQDQTRQLLTNMATEMSKLYVAVQDLTEEVTWIRDHAVVQTRTKIFGR